MAAAVQPQAPLIPAGVGLAWAPQPGPQTALVTCPVYDVGFGGARFGGKTDGILGDFAAHSMTWTNHARGLIVRRTYDELDEVISRSMEIYSLLDATWKGSKHTWFFPWGSFLRMRYLKRDEDASRYQGHSYCVAVGTPVLMADGTWTPIEQVHVGDMVQTLEGPRRVTARVRPYRAPCVRAVVRVAGQVVAEQVHPEWHPLLATAGLTYARTPRSHRSEHQCPDAASAPGMPAGTPPGGGHREPPGWFAYATVQGSAYTAPSPTRRDAEPPRALTVPVVLHAPSLRSALSSCQALEPTPRHALDRSLGPSSGSVQAMRVSASDPVLPRAPGAPALDRCDLSPASAPACDPHETTTARGSRVGCPTDSDCDGGPAPAWSGSDPGSPPSPGDAGAPRRAQRADASGTTPTRSRGGPCGWVHPYTGEVRYLAEETTVGEAEVVPCGDALVADLTVEGANHYITLGGLVNKNTYLGVDEMGNFAKPDPIDKLRATLRSVAGVPVRFRGSMNPGGPGHGWIVDRYIRPAPPFTPFIDPVTGAQRVFIPSRIEDNALGVAKDPGYRDRLKQAGPPWLVRAWMEGDWNATPEGGLIKAEWLRNYWDVLPSDIYAYVISLDTGYKENQANDPSVATVWAIGHYAYYLVDVWRERAAYPRLKHVVANLCEKWRPTAVLIEDKASGQSLIQEMRGSTRWPVIPIEPVGDKFSRALAMTPTLETGKVFLPRVASWLLDYEIELTCFPHPDMHDDQVDSTSQFIVWATQTAGARFEVASSGQKRVGHDTDGFQ